MPQQEASSRGKEAIPPPPSGLLLCPGGQEGGGSGLPPGDAVKHGDMDVSCQKRGFLWWANGARGDHVDLHEFYSS
jgi:hypothetical protein